MMNLSGIIRRGNLCIFIGCTWKIYTVEHDLCAHAGFVREDSGAGSCGHTSSVVVAYVFSLLH